MANDNPRINAEQIKAATYDVPTSLSNPTGDDFIIFKGFLSTPSGDDKLRLHGKWHDFENYVEFPVKDVIWLDTRTDTVGNPLESTVFLSAKSHCEFSGEPRFTLPDWTKGASLIASGASISSVAQYIGSQDSKTSRLGTFVPQSQISYKPWMQSAASRLMLGFDDSGNLSSGSGLDENQVQYSFNVETYTGNLADPDGAIRKFAIRHVRFSKDQDVPLEFSTLICLERSVFRLAVSRGALELILNFDFSAAGSTGIVRRTITHNGVLFSSQDGTYVISNQTASLTLPLGAIFWPYRDRVFYFEPLLAELIADVFLRIVSDLNGLPATDALAYYISRRKLGILAAAGIAGLVGFVAGAATGGGAWLLGGAVWGLAGFDSTAWGMIAYDGITSTPDGGSEGGSSGPGAGAASTASSGSPGDGGEKPKPIEQSKDDPNKGKQ